MRVANEYWVPLRLQNDERPVPRLLRVAYALAGAMAGALLILMLLATFLVKPTQVEGNSMAPALGDGQWLLISAMPRKLRYGDIAVISNTGTGLGKPIIKRVIGLPGDGIDIDFRRGIVYRNRVALRESCGPTHRQFDMAFPLTVPEGRCFVLGDNRGESEDSRSSRVGLVDLRDVIGAQIEIRQWIGIRQ